MGKFDPISIEQKQLRYKIHSYNLKSNGWVFHHYVCERRTQG